MYSLRGLGDYNGWCFKFPGQRDTLTVASPGVIAAPGCSNQPPGTVQNWTDGAGHAGTITCLSSPTGGFNADCTPIAVVNPPASGSTATVAGSCFGIPGDPSACLSLIPRPRGRGLIEARLAGRDFATPDQFHDRAVVASLKLDQALELAQNADNSTTARSWPH